MLTKDFPILTRLFDALLLGGEAGAKKVVQGGVLFLGNLFPHHGGFAGLSTGSLCCLGLLRSYFCLQLGSIIFVSLQNVAALKTRKGQDETARRESSANTVYR